MSKIKQLAALVAATMAMAENPKLLYDERELVKESRFFCGNCVNCPKGGKTFCKLVKHNVTTRTPANNCNHFKMRE